MHRASKLLAISVLTAITLPLPSYGAEDMTTQEIKDGFREHAALTQFHRWYLLYEEPKYGIDNQLDILGSDVAIKSGLGEAKGHQQYVDRVKQIPTSWENAHGRKVNQD